MTILTILKYPDKRLHKVAKPVTQFDDNLKQLASDMVETMYAAPGIGLAATQVDRHLQLVVIDISETRNQLHVLVNPDIIWRSEEKILYQEGCLSVPTIYDEVERSAQIKLRACKLDGQMFELDADDLLAICIQHELDHLKGIVFVDYLSPLKRNRIKTKLSKLLKEEEREEAKAKGHNQRNRVVPSSNVAS